MSLLSRKNNSIDNPSAISKDSEYSNIYINGLKIAEESNFLFSYNITALNKQIIKALNRERTNVGRSAYGDRIKSILTACNNSYVYITVSRSGR